MSLSGDQKLRNTSAIQENGSRSGARPASRSLRASRFLAFVGADLEGSSHLDAVGFGGGELFVLSEDDGVPQAGDHRHRAEGDGNQLVPLRFADFGHLSSCRMSGNVLVRVKVRYSREEPGDSGILALGAPSMVKPSWPFILLAKKSKWFRVSSYFL